MKLEDTDKFEAETLRTMAFVTGTPFGTIFLQFVMFGFPKNLLLMVVEIGVASVSLWLFVYFMNMAYDKGSPLLQKGEMNNGR